jgi:hypothetical protein
MLLDETLPDYCLRHLPYTEMGVTAMQFQMHEGREASMYAWQMSTILQEWLKGWHAKGAKVHWCRRKYVEQRRLLALLNNPGSYMRLRMTICQMPTGERSQQDKERRAMPSGSLWSGGFL